MEINRTHFDWSTFFWIGTFPEGNLHFVNALIGDQAHGQPQKVPQRVFHHPPQDLEVEGSFVLSNDCRTLQMEIHDCFALEMATTVVLTRAIL